MPNTLSTNHLLVYFNSKPEPIIIIKKSETSGIKALPASLAVQGSAAQPAESPSETKAWKYHQKVGFNERDTRLGFGRSGLAVGLCHLFPLFDRLVSLDSRFFGTWDISSQPSAECSGLISLLLML